MSYCVFVLPVSGVLQNAGGLGLSFFLGLSIFFIWKHSDNHLQKVQKEYLRAQVLSGWWSLLWWCVLPGFKSE